MAVRIAFYGIENQTQLYRYISACDLVQWTAYRHSSLTWMKKIRFRKQQPPGYPCCPNMNKESTAYVTQL